MKQPGEHRYVPCEEWLRSDKTHLRVRKMKLLYGQRKNIPFKNLEEALQWSLRMAPYLNNLEEMIITMVLGREEKIFDCLWTLPCHTLSYDGRNISFLMWHLKNNDRLKCLSTGIFSYNDVRDLLPLCAEKRLTWKMTSILLPSTLQCLKTWQGDAQWMEIYPLVIEPEDLYPRRGKVFYEDEHVRKEFVWTSDHEAYLTVTWK
uniref:FBA_1 domain-containing protein n=1 Tax=Steinernema glaseri TaxID=37863 RepID=A0A1I7Z084_9BILA